MAEGGPQARHRRLAPLLREAERLLHANRVPAIALLAAAIFFSAAAGGYELLKRPADVHNPDAAFVPQKPPQLPKRAKTVNWPMFGLNPARTRYLPAQGVRPPFRKLWRFTDRPLLEFPPIYVGGRLYFVNNNGYAHALDADTGKELWKRRVGALNASSPTYYRHRLYIVNLVPGHVVKLDAKTGRTIWKKPLPSRAESSPVVIDRSVYFGCEDGNLYALSTISGNVRWATGLGGRLGPRLLRQQRRPRLQLRHPRRRARLELLDRGLRLLGPDGGQHPAQPADRLHRLLRRQRLRARCQGRRPALEPLGGRAGDRLALGGGGHRLRRRVHRQDDLRLHDEERQARLPLWLRHLLAGDLRRPPHLPDRLLEHHRAAAVRAAAEAGEEGDEARNGEEEAGAGEERRRRERR
jgi:hypothetical protein